jgi:amidase
MTAALTPSDVDTIAGLDATGQAALVAAGEVTAEELVESAIARIERLNPRLVAVVTTMYDQARAAVAAGLPAGPFQGVPFLVKDLCAEVAGVPMSEGSEYLRGFVSDTDSELVVRHRRAGLVLLGKTSTPEFGMLPTAESRRYGATANPWDPSRTAGGSSGGSAAAVAAGMVPFAHGNDAGGSIRIPASCCGLFGFKPTRARNPLGPRYGDIFSGLVVEHALTRSVRDSAALLDATSGPASGDPYGVAPPDRPFASEVGRPPGRLRIGYSLRTPGGQAVHPHCVAALRDAVELLTDLGHDLTERDLPGLDETVGAAIGTVYRAGVAWVVEHWTRRLSRPPAEADLEPLTRLYLEAGQQIGAGRYLLAVEDLQAFSRTVAAFLTDIDVWLTPTLAQPPVPLGQLVSTEDDPFRVEAAMNDFVPFPAVVANITGGPAMSVPLYWSDDGLPIGVHLLGRYADDASLFRLAGQLEHARDWTRRRPPLAAEGEL